MDNNPQKRILYLLEYLYAKTDDAHPVSTSELIRYLSERGITCDRRAIYADIELFDTLGVDIIQHKSRQNLYHIGARHFQLPELRLLVDAIQSSRFVTAKKSAELIDKLRLFAGEHQAAQLDRLVFMDGMAKPENEMIYLTVDIIQSAIADNCRITFQYYEYLPTKEKVLKHDGRVYTLSPYGLMWNNDFYYIVGFSETHGKTTQFRVDRITNAALTEIPRVIDDNFDIDDYRKEIFGMFPDAMRTVTLLCENRLMKSVIDYFGEDVETEITDNEHFKAVVDAAPSPPFFAWVFTFCGGIRITSPDEVVDEMSKMASEFVKK